MELQWENDLVVTISGSVMEAKNDETTSLLKKLDQLLYSAKVKSI